MKKMYALKNNKITKDGHTMFLDDILTDLNRKDYLEKQRNKLIDFYINFESIELGNHNTILKEILFGK